MESNSQVKIIGFVGSPRKKGNTDVLVEEILVGAKEVGASTEKVMLNELDIGSCQACDTCRQTGKCKQEDDMVEIEKKMNQNKIWVIGTPIYWWGPSAQLKTFIDRWYCARQVQFKERRIILAIALGGSESIARHTVGMITDICNYLNMNLFETIIVPGVSDRGEITKKTIILEKARDIGKKAVKTSFDQI